MNLVQKLSGPKHHWLQSQSRSETKQEVLLLSFLKPCQTAETSVVRVWVGSAGLMKGWD